MSAARGFVPRCDRSPPPPLQFPSGQLVAAFRYLAPTSPANEIRSRRASAARSTCLVINVTVSIIARSPPPTPKTALAPKAFRGRISSQSATVASPATVAKHSIKLVEEPPRSSGLSGRRPSHGEWPTLGRDVLWAAWASLPPIRRHDALRYKALGLQLRRGARVPRSHRRGRSRVLCQSRTNPRCVLSAALRSLSRARFVVADDARAHHVRRRCPCGYVAR